MSALLKIRFVYVAVGGGGDGLPWGYLEIPFEAEIYDTSFTLKVGCRRL